MLSIAHNLHLLGSDGDTVAGFEDDVDTLQLDESFWGGGLTIQRILETYGSETTANVLDFGNGDTLRVVHSTEVSKASIVDDISFI